MLLFLRGLLDDLFAVGHLDDVVLLRAGLVVSVLVVVADGGLVVAGHYTEPRERLTVGRLLQRVQLLKQLLRILDLIIVERLEGRLQFALREQWTICHSSRVSLLNIINPFDGD